MSADDFKAKGNAAFTKGNFDEAVKMFTEAINLDPTNHILYSNRSGAYASLKKYQEALKDADKTVDLKPDWAKGYSRQATALHYLGDYTKAEQVCQQGLQIEPNNQPLKQALEDARRAKANQQSSDSMGGAEKAFQDMFKGDVIGKLKANPETARYLAQPDFLKIINDLQTNSNPLLLNQYMRDPRVMSAIGVLLGINLKTATPEEFAKSNPEDFMQSSTSPSSSPKTTTNNNNNYNTSSTTSSTSSSSSSSSSSKKDNDVPMKEAEVVEELSPEKKEAEAEKAKGNTAYSKKDFDTAITHYSKALELDKDNVVYYTNRAAAHFEKGDYQACIKDCETAVEEGRRQRVDYKQIAKALTRIGNAYMKLDNLEEAIKHYDKSLTEDRTAQTLSLLQKAEKLKEEREKKAYLDPTKAQEAKDKGNKFFSDGNYPDAIKEYSEALKRNPDDHTLYSNRAASYTKLAEYKLALKDADTCISMKPDFAKGYSRKGHAHYFLKEYEEALKAYEKGLEFDPNNSEMTEGVKRTLTAMNQQTMKAQSSSGSDEETLQNAMKDPEVVQILSDPVMRQILSDMQNDPGAAQNHLNNPLVRTKIQKLINSGVLKVGKQ